MNIERRYIAPSEVRFTTSVGFDTASADGSVAVADVTKLEGYAALFNVESNDMGGWTEQIAPGAFAVAIRNATISTNPDDNIFFLPSHNMDATPWGSVQGGKLKLVEDEIGLRFSLDASRLTPAEIDAALSGEFRMSFGMYCLSDQWDQRPDGSVIRTVLVADVIEISSVLFAAYSQTSLNARSLDTRAAGGEVLDGQKSFEAWKAKQATDQSDREELRERVNNAYLNTRLRP